MKKLFICLSLTVFLISCNVKENDSINEEIKVINDTFTKLPFITDGSKTFPPLHDMPTFDKDPELTRKEKDYEIKKHKFVDKAKILGYDLNIIIMQCSDTLFQQPRYDNKSRGDYNSVTSYKRKEDDSLFSTPIRDFLNNKKSIIHFNLSAISNRGNYKLVSIKELPRTISSDWPSYEFNYGGFLRFSRVYFSWDMKYAIYEYYYFFRVDDCNCHLIYCEKINGKWQIKKTVSTMIA